jgi:hypothetical protein
MGGTQMSNVHPYRGKRIDNGEWVHGFALEAWDGTSHIITSFGPYATNCLECGSNETESHEIDPETVGQYTGLNDKNGKEMFDGDLWISRPEGRPYEIKWYETGWYLYLNKTKHYENADGLSLGEKVGNRWDNPELLNN